MLHPSTLDKVRALLLSLLLTSSQRPAKLGASAPMTRSVSKLVANLSNLGLLTMRSFLSSNSNFKPLSSRHVSRHRLFLFVACVLILNLVLNFPWARRHDDGIIHIPSMKSAPQHPRIVVWDAPHCTGSFSSVAAEHSRLNIPYAIVRDVVLDRRPISHVALSPTSNATHRLLLYVSVHLSAQLTREASRVAVTLRNATVPGIAAAMEYVMHANHFVRRSGSRGHHYRPGDTTIFGREVTEWQVGVGIQELALGALNAAIAARAKLHVHLRLRRFDGAHVPFHVELPLACVLGWHLPRPLAKRKPACGPRARGASGAVMLPGTPLAGPRKRSRTRHAEVANYAARALFGAVQFDTVIIPVVVDFSASDVLARCGANVACRKRFVQANRRFLRTVGANVETELARLGVPTRLFDRVIVVPSCRLGSDAVGSERGDPCRISKRYGQYYSSFFSYAMVAPLFKWAASFEFDEFVWPSSGMKVEQRTAVDVLDQADSSLDGEGHMVMQWLTYKVRSFGQTRALSKRLLRGETGKLRHVGNGSLSERCYYRRADGAGKPAVRCDVGAGFTIHHPVLPKAGSQMMRFDQGTVQYRGLRAWHTRPSVKPGMCYIDETQ